MQSNNRLNPQWQHIQGSRRVFAATPTQAEGLVVLEALRVAHVGVDNMLIKTDSVQIVEALKHLDKAKEELKHIVRDIYREAQKRKYVICIKVDRSKVAKAHKLAIACRKFA
uniref:RNase H type-1 domain-containing protein n=1 Tax=Chenopodium quinoa TaxID=63459 RepID=A0A803NB50_CHEQI